MKIVSSSSRTPVVEVLEVPTVKHPLARRNAIRTQRTINRQVAKKYGLSIIKTISIPEDSSPKDFLAPGWSELRRVIGAPEVKGILAVEFRRVLQPKRFAGSIVRQMLAGYQVPVYLKDGRHDFGSELARPTQSKF